jgi:hypothetical protein
MYNRLGKRNLHLSSSKIANEQNTNYSSAKYGMLKEPVFEEYGQINLKETRGRVMKQ